MKPLLSLTNEIIAVAFGLLSISLIILFFYFNKLKQKIKTLQNQLDQTKKLIENERANSSKLIDIIFNSFDDGILIINPQGIIIHYNRSLNKWFSLPEQINNKKLSEVFQEDVTDVLTKLLNDKSPESSANIELKHPRLCNLYVERAIIKDENGNLYGTAFVFHDHTRLATLEKTRREFVANVSHELRTPLTLIKGCVETLLEGGKDDPEVSSRFLQTIKKHSDRLNFLIEDLLTISKLESGETKLNLEKLNLKKIVQEVIDDLQDQAEAKSVAIYNKIEESLSVMASPERLKQVFYNLIDNAIKYGRIDGNIWITAESDEANVKIMVKDDGPGIPPEARERIFERFFRVDKARSREQGGTGLGLSIVKHIVQAHGGKVWVESQFGKGATFCFTLPMRSETDLTSSK
jgi:two-component system phosphate regulon sensor histidine kinase PhoR